EREGTFANLRAPLLTLTAAAVTHFAWWTVLESEAATRHLLPAVVYFAVAASVAAAANARISARAGALAVVAIVCSWLPADGRLKIVFRGQFRPEPRLVALRAARDEMVRLQADRRFVFVGWDWWAPRDLEYLLPAAQNFKDARRLQPDEVKGRTIVLVHSEYF